MAITWRNEMSVDGGIIDEDHKCLIDLVNAVDLVKPGPMMLAELNKILAKLCEYARVHFDREERLQVASAFTYAQAHRSRHRALVGDLQSMIAACNATAPEELGEFRLRLSEFLFHWLRDRIVKVDLLMKPFVEDMRRHAKAAAPLSQVVQMLIPVLLSGDRFCPATLGD